MIISKLGGFSYYLCGLFFLCVTSVQADNQGTKLLNRPSATLPPLPDYVPRQAPETIILPEIPQSKPYVLKNTQFFTLKGIVLEENHAVSDETLIAAVANFIDTIISLSDLETIRLTLTQVYKDKGYLSSGAVLKDQHISDGWVTFEIIEGRLEKINIANAGRLRDDYISSRILINNEGPLRSTELHKNFQLLLTDPLIERLNGVLKPGVTAGSTVLDLEVTRKSQPYALYINFDNYTPPSIGAYSGRLHGSIRNLTGFGDRVGFALSISEGLKSLGLNYTIPISRYNTRLLFDFQTSHSEVIESTLARLSIESTFYHVELGISHPVYHSLNRKVILDARFAYRENTTFFLGHPFPLGQGAAQNQHPAVSVLRLAQSFTDRGQYHAFSLRSIISIGIDAFNSNVSKNAADSDFFSWIGQAHYAHRLHDNGAQAVVRGSVQLSNDTLLPLERFALGGHATVRGYRENYRVKDEGYFVAAELYYPLLPSANGAGYQLTAVPFINMGASWNQGDRHTETLYSAGIGFQWRWHRLKAQLFWAHTFSQPESQNEHNLQDDGIQFQFSSQIF